MALAFYMAPRLGVFTLLRFFDGLCERIYMMFSIAYQLLQRLFLLVARIIFVRVLAAIEILLAPISWYSRVNPLHI
ncbi:MAG: hypothetical protein EAZ90_28245 [Oscillatoriales cyanobacterium]|nr:MAG: hypothetical protein EAZ94_03645 [Oscillatoriales cyanobacterium]TAE36500.1 MAG: hypothetical protein EAZ90_28245 [Oscillatoriales cyanobacterium]TAE53714.1 MAG: hypothetical protein EAZ88_11095 [Oscillatoriales cyanobacterium]TAE68437.1 MAG: hypothetical protein EAZ86_13715 [Oscillatoriales cyanobacterium]TAF91907.1 MAG: hypothetical protein EAZ49_03810 [Oscillatoriales cyanobacterium]